MNVQSIEKNPYIQNPLIAPIIHFHGRIVSTFDDLPENGKVVEIAIRIAALVISPLAYLALGILALIGLAYHSLQSTYVSDPEQVQQTVTNPNSTTPNLGLAQPQDVSTEIISRVPASTQVLGPASPQQTVTTGIMPQNGVFNNLETQEKDSSVPIDLEEVERAYWRALIQKMEKNEKEMQGGLFSSESAMLHADDYEKLGNMTKAVEWYAEAAKKGNLYAKNKLNKLKGKDLSFSIKLKEIENAYKSAVTKEVERREKEMEDGQDRFANTNAMFLADLYKEIGNIPKAVEWYAEAAKKGNSYAKSELKRLKAKDSSLPIDLGEIENAYKSAVTQEVERREKEMEDGQDGFANTSAWVLAYMYNEIGNIPKAVEWYAEAAKKGNPCAKGELKRLKEKDSSLPIDLGEIEKAYKSAVTQEIERGEKEMEGKVFSDLSVCHFANLYKEIGNTAKAEEWYAEAAKKGNLYAKNNLEILQQGQK